MQTRKDIFRNVFKRGLGQVPYLSKGLNLVYRAAPFWMIVWFVLLVAQGLLPVALVYLTRALVDGLVVIVQGASDWETLRPTLVWVVLMGGVLLAKEALRGGIGLARTVLGEQTRDFMSGLIHQKSNEIDLAYYDMPEYHDMLHRARAGAALRPMNLLESSGVLLQNGLTLGAMLLVLLPYAAWLPAVLLVSTLPAFYIVLHHRLRLHQWTVRNTPDERRSWYYDWLLTARDSAAELRLFQLSDHFQAAFQTLRRRLRDERIQLMKDQSRAELFAGLAALLVTGLAVAWMIWQVVQGRHSLGDLALFYSAFNQGQSLMRALMENMGEIYSNSFFLSDLFEFLALAPRVPEPESPRELPSVLKDGVHFERVTFFYPGSERSTLHEFDLHLAAGKITAIVGANGAGKSTLIKLLCRFYDPQQGAITLDGIDVRHFSLDSLRSGITVLFQEPVHYGATVRENIALGDLAGAPDIERIRTAARSAGADELISRLPSAYETMLGKWFQGGADLSVGEWQRLALSRAFLRQAPLIILDEPTSAMDPWAEADWLERFRQLAAGRTALLITHRFTTAAHADVIYVMDNGQIVEAGSHRQLLHSGGRYAASWKDQMQRWMDAGE